MNIAQLSHLREVQCDTQEMLYQLSYKPRNDLSIYKTAELESKIHQGGNYQDFLKWGVIFRSLSYND